MVFVLSRNGRKGSGKVLRGEPKPSKCLNPERRDVSVWGYLGRDREKSHMAERLQIKRGRFQSSNATSGQRVRAVRPSYGSGSISRRISAYYPLSPLSPPLPLTLSLSRFLILTLSRALSVHISACLPMVPSRDSQSVLVGHHFVGRSATHAVRCEVRTG